jgi:hypothetical protein
MKRALFLLLLLAPSSTLADEPRRRPSFSSGNGQFELKILGSEWDSNGSWSLVEKATGAVRYRLTGELSSRTVLVSDDGRNLVAVDDFSESLAEKDLDVLSFYRDGKLIRKYRLGQLLRDPSNVSASTSHFQWFFENPPLSIQKGRVRLRTFELIRYEFDAVTGETLRKEVDHVLTPRALYVYGPLEAIGGNRYAVKICQLAYGKAPKDVRVEFEAASGALPSHHPEPWVAVVIQDGKLVRVEDVMLNSCNLEHSWPKKE